MKILLLAPHPLLSDRGSPIATALLLKAVSEFGAHEVDVVTYPEGRDLDYPRVQLFRVKDYNRLRGIKPGFSVKKLLLDGLVLKECWRLCGETRYDMVHCLEETVYIAMLLKRRFGIPYVYDMDSSLAQQMVEKFQALRPFAPILDFFEGRAIKGAEIVVPVCPILADRARAFGAKRVETLEDISLLKPASNKARLRERLSGQGPILLYVGNMETYQGLDLMMESFALVAPEFPDARLVIAGPGDRAKLDRLCRDLRIENAVSFIGPWPLEQLGDLLVESDILLSPRIKGTNTPMKLYSYLHSGKPVLATRLPTHTQIISDRQAALAEPNPQAFAEAMKGLLTDEGRRQALGSAGKALVEERYTYKRFKESVGRIYPG